MFMAGRILYSYFRNQKSKLISRIIRSFIYIDDFADAIKSLIDTQEMGTYIGTNDANKIFDLISLMMQIYCKSKICVQILENCLYGSVTRRCPDIQNN